MLAGSVRGTSGCPWAEMVSLPSPRPSALPNLSTQSVRLHSSMVLGVPQVVNLMRKFMERFSRFCLLKIFYSQYGKTEYSLSQHNKTNDLVVWQSSLKIVRI